MADLFRNSSPGALTLKQSVELARKRLVERGLQMRKARELAAHGRGDDTEVAHVAPGEYVIPRALQTPELLNLLHQAAAEKNIPFEALRIGSDKNSINPKTGMPEFGLGDWISDAGGLISGAGDWMYRQVTGNEPPNPAIKPPSDMFIPPDASLSQNIQDAKEHWDPTWFYNQVRNRKGQDDYKWDYKQGDKRSQDFGNFNYGATGAAFGFPDSVLKRGAGWAHGRSGNEASGNWWGEAPYGDDPHDQEMIQKGIDYYRRGGR